MVRKAAVLELSPEIEKIKTTLNTSLNGKVIENIELRTKIDVLRINAIYPDENQLIIRTSAKGNVSINL